MVNALAQLAENLSLISGRDHYNGIGPVVQIGQKRLEWNLGLEDTADI